MRLTLIFIIAASLYGQVGVVSPGVASPGSPSISLSTPFTPGQQNPQTAYIGNPNGIGPFVSQYIAQPSAVTAAAGATGALTGTYLYWVSVCESYGNFLNQCSDISPSATVALTAQNGSLSSIPNPTGTVARILWRSVAGGTTPKFLVKITDNSTTTYADTTPDSGLGAAPIYGSSNLTGGAWMSGTTPVPLAVVGQDSTAIGYGAFASCLNCFQSGTTNQRTWGGTGYSVPLLAPAGPNATASSTSGTCPASTTYYYIVASSDGQGGYHPTAEITGSIGATGTSTNSVLVSWSASTGADFYRVYKGTAAGLENVSSDVFGSTSLRDTCSNITASNFPPAYNTAAAVSLNSTAQSWMLLGLRLGLSGQFKVDSSGNLIAPSHTGTGAATFAPQTGAGTGATAACATSHVCDSFSGEVTLTSGTIPAIGSDLIITLPITRTNQPNCAVELKGGTLFLGDTKTTTTSTITISTGAALAAATAYTIDYVCGGN